MHVRRSDKRALTFVEFLLVVIITAVAVAILFDREFGGHPPSPVSRAQADMRSLATCIESYYVDQKAYPVHASGAEGANGSFPKDPAFQLTTFRQRQWQNDPLYSLTTPISYCTTFFADPFAGRKNITFCYYSLQQENPKAPAAWIIWSAGPDKDYDLTPATDYSPGPGHPSPALINKTYDPTNGAKSDGDVWRAKQ